MKKLVRYLYKKVTSLLREPPVDLVEELKKTGNLKHGYNCKFENLRIIYTESRTDNFCNIQIGNNCHITCTIVLLNPKAKVIIGNDVFIGDSMIFCYEDIEIRDNVLISWGCTLIDNNTHSLISSERKEDVVKWMKGPEFKDWSVVKKEKILVNSSCWIGFNSILTKGVVLGEGTIVASGSVITKSTLPFSIMGGNPAQLIRKTE